MHSSINEHENHHLLFGHDGSLLMDGRANGNKAMASIMVRLDDGSCRGVASRSQGSEGRHRFGGVLVVFGVIRKTNLQQ